LSGNKAQTIRNLNTMYKIAFHLAKGANFQKFQIRDANNEATYIEPNDFDIILNNCKLKNQKGASLRIFNGGAKERCSWIEFESYEIVAKSNYVSDTEVRFNPRVSATWIVGGLNNQDNSTFAQLKTNGRKIYK